MAYFEVLSGDSYGRYNIKLAKLTNLQTAVYWSCILNVISKVVQKKTYDQSGYFILDRKYVERQTTLTTEEQGLCDKALEQLEVLKVDPTNENRVSVNLEQMLSLLISDDQKTLKTIGKIAKVSRADKAASKKEGVIHRLQNRIVEEDVELLEAYKRWIEAVYSKGMQSNAQFDVFKATIEDYSDDKRVKLDLINTATSLAYKEAAWAIQMYEKNNKNVIKKVSTAQPKASLETVIDFE